MSDKRRDDDLNWLYRKENSSADEHTRVFSAEEMARMNADAAAGGSGQAPRSSAGASGGAGAGAGGTIPPPPPRSRPTQQAGPSGQPAAPTVTKRRRKRHPVRNTILVLLALWLVFLIGTPIFAWTRGTVVDAAPAGERPAEQPGTAVLLVGSDARDDLTPEERSRLRTGSTEGRRTDTMMILYTPPSGRSALISLPRDSFVSIPGHKKNKLNAAYAFGGAPLLIQTVEANTGIRIDGYLEIGFLGLVDTVDAVGGIEVCPKAPIKDKDSHLDLPAGCQTLDGVTALGYVRMRKADPRGDLGRMERQREVIGKVVGKATNPLHLLNPVTYWKLNMAVSKSVSRSESVGIGEMTAVTGGFFNAALGNGLSLTVPVSDANAKTSAGSSMIWDEKLSTEMFEAVQRGDTAALEKFEQ